VTPGSYSSVWKVTTSKLRQKRIPSSVSVLRLVLPSTKTCSFSFVLPQRLVLSELILSEEASFVLGSSYTKTCSFMKTTTTHFDFNKCFVIIKTSLRRSFDDQLYIISFGSSTTTSHFDFKCFIIIKTSPRRLFGDRLYIISFSSSLALNFKSKNICDHAYFIWTGFAIVTSSFGSRKAS
jgi:hypothetical protein